MSEATDRHMHEYRTLGRTSLKVSPLGLYAARAQTFAELNRLEPIACLQLEYSLVSRSLEREHVPLALETGISIIPWSLLASGFLTGKYRRADGKVVGAGRVSEYQDSGNPTLEKFAKRERNWDVLDALLTVARATDRTPTEIALAWVIGRPQVATVLIGATRKDQLELNLSALDIRLTPESERLLTETSKPESTELDHFFEPTMQSMVHGGVTVRRGIRR